MGQFRRALHPPRGAAGDGLIAGIGKVEGVRPDEHRRSHSTGLNQVLPAERLEAAADERHVAGGIVGEHFPHGIAQHELCGAIHVFITTPPHKFQPALFDERGDGIESLRMTGHDDREQSGHIHFADGIQQQFLLALARARRQKYSAAGTESMAQRCAEFEHVSRWCDIEFHVAANGYVVCSECPQSLGIGRCLRANARQLREAQRGDVAKFFVAAGGFRRQPRVHQPQRQSPSVTGRDQVGPDLGFHDEPLRRAEMIEKARHGKRRIVGQITAQDLVAEQRLTRRSPRRRHVGEENLVFGITCLQGADQRCRRAGLADGDGVQPDDRPRWPGGITAEALADELAVARLLARAPAQAQPGERQQQEHQQRVQTTTHISGRRPSAGPPFARLRSLSAVYRHRPD